MNHTASNCPTKQPQGIISVAFIISLWACDFFMRS